MFALRKSINVSEITGYLYAEIKERGKEREKGRKKGVKSYKYPVIK